MTPAPSESRGARIERLLRERFHPVHLELHDQSAAHAGHGGAAAGGGHFQAIVVSTAFEGVNRVERHRMVYQALGDLVGTEIHAIGLKTLAPSEWQR